MKLRLLIAVSLLAVACTGVGCAAHPSSGDTSSGAAMTHHARGPFDVSLKPLEPYNKTEGAGLGRMSIDKQFHGGLEAVSQGEMLSAGSPAKGSAGYVAIERVTGTLDGRSGSFVLQHNATMNRGVPSLNIIVVPDSGTGELAGLSGTMTIVIADGKHSYDFEYSLPESGAQRP